MITSKLTSKAQTTIPQAVRHHLGLGEGNLLGFTIEGARVLLCKPAPKPELAADPMFLEWNSESDRQAFNGL